MNIFWEHIKQDYLCGAGMEFIEKGPKDTINHALDPERFARPFMGKLTHKMERHLQSSLCNSSSRRTTNTGFQLRMYMLSV